MDQNRKCFSIFPRFLEKCFFISKEKSSILKYKLDTTLKQLMALTALSLTFTG